MIDRSTTHDVMISPHPGTSPPPVPRTGASWRNPPFAWRVVLVGGVWALPGALLGLLTAVVFQLPLDAMDPAAAGAGLSATAGATLEAFW